MKQENIIKRVSVRKYKAEPLSVLKILEIEDLVKNQEPLFNINYQIDVVQDGLTFQNVIGGIVGSYGKVHAPHYLIASTELKDECYENIGYVLEKIVLKLTEMNIATCWIGGGIKKDLFRDFLKLNQNLTPVAVIAFGYPIKDDVFRKNLNDFSRKKLEDLYTGELSDVNRKILELVRVSPSSINSQPWRFHFKTNEEVFVFRVKNFVLLKPFIGEMNRIDLGIAICHFEIGAKLLGKSIRLVTEQVDEKKLIYFKTIKIVK